MSLLSVKEETRPTSDKINLVSRVGLLRVTAHRRVKFDH